METKAFCAYNLTRDSFLSVKVIVADLVCAPSGASDSLISELELDPESSLWLTPLTEASQLAGLPSSDLVYLDRNNRILQAVELAPGTDLPPFGGLVASALILPQGTLQSTNSRLGDQLTVCDDMRMVAYLKRLSYSTAEYFGPESAETQTERSLDRHFLCEPIPVRVAIIESLYEQFPSPLLFMPSVTDAGLDSTGFRIDGPQNRLLFTAHVITRVTVGPVPLTEELQDPVLPAAADEISAVGESIEAPLDELAPPLAITAASLAEAAQNFDVSIPGEIISLGQSMIVSADESSPPAVAVPDSLIETTQNETVSVPDALIPPAEPPILVFDPANDQLELPLSVVGSISVSAELADQPTVAQSPHVEVSEAPTTLQQRVRKRLHGLKRFVKRPRKIQTVVEVSPATEIEPPEAQAAPIPASAIPAVQTEQPAEDLPSVPSFALSLPVDNLPGIETTAGPDLSSPISATEDEASGNPEVTNQEEPHFFVPKPIRFFDPVENAALQKSADAGQDSQSDKEVSEQNGSTGLTQALRDVILQLTEQEKERRKQELQPTVDAESKKREVETIEPPAAFADQEMQQPALESQPTELSREEAELAWTEEAKFELQVAELRKKKANKKTPGQVPEIAETAEQAESQAEEKRKIAARLQSWLEARNARKIMGPCDRRQSSRVREPGLVAYYFTGGTPRPFPVEHISNTGFYIRTKEHWLPNTMLLMTIQRPDRKLGDPLHAITVLTKVVRIDPEGVGHEFVMTESLTRKTLDIMPDMGTDRLALSEFLQPLQ